MTRIISGLQPVREAIRAHGAALERVLVLAAPESPQLDALARYAGDQGAKVERVQRGELDRLARGAKHQGAVAIATELRLRTLEEVGLGEGSLVVVLDELQDPQNFGAIIRSSVAMGATAIVWPEHRSAPLSPATFRASAGAVEHATLCRVGGLPDALARMKAANVRVIGLDMGAPRSIDEIDLKGPIALVVGAEGKGLRKTVKNACDELASLPMGGPLASLNASVAIAIALYETARQRKRPSPN